MTDEPDDQGRELMVSSLSNVGSHRPSVTRTCKEVRVEGNSSILRAEEDGSNSQRYSCGANSGRNRADLR